MPTATDFKDYYAILGVSKTVAPEEIKRAYRQLARKHHPDLNPGDKSVEAKFKDLNEANEVLSDPEKRQKYDQFGQQWNQTRESAPPERRSAASTEDFEQYGDFDAFINDLMGRSRRRTTGGFDGFGDGYRSQAPAPDTEAAFALTFSEAFHGVQKRLQLDDETIRDRNRAIAQTARQRLDIAQRRTRRLIRQTANRHATKSQPDRAGTLRKNSGNDQL